MSITSASEERLPSESPRDRRAVQGLSCLALAVTLAYLVWRVTTTLDGADLWLGWPMLLLEVHAAVGLGLFTFSLWRVDSLTSAEAVDETHLRVAVLIPTYNEPEEVLLPTVAAALALRPQHETWVLDDGDRPEVRALARELGAGYLARHDRSDAKAGNLNHALSHIDADVVAVLDADHVAEPDFLRHTLGYFSDPSVALVQTPQDFYNEGSFEHVESEPLGLRRQLERSYSEQALFYRAVQPGKNRWEAAFWCGTGALLRVAALRDVGGVATGAVTEDIQTTIRLHRRGWRSVYHNEVLARGLAAATVEQYALQRHRWCTGAMQVLRRERPLTGDGLGLRQRLAYAATLTGWFDAWRTLGYQLLPIAVLVTGAVPLRAWWATFLVWFGVTFLLQQLALRALGRGYSRLLPAMVFELVRMTPTLLATTTLVRRSSAEFRVTPKGRSESTRARQPAPRLLVALLAVSVAGAAWYGATLAGLTPLSYDVPWVAHGALFWLVLNAGLVVAALGRVRAQRYAGERRASVRFDVQRAITAGEAEAVLLDVSLTGARVHTDRRLPDDGRTVTLDLPEDCALASVKAAVRSRERGHETGQIVGLEFVDVRAADRALLALWAFGLDRPQDAPQPVPARTGLSRHTRAA